MPSARLAEHGTAKSDVEIDQALKLSTVEIVYFIKRAVGKVAGNDRDRFFIYKTRAHFSCIGKLSFEIVRSATCSERITKGGSKGLRRSY